MQSNGSSGSGDLRVEVDTTIFYSCSKYLGPGSEEEDWIIRMEGTITAARPEATPTEPPTKIGNLEFFIVRVGEAINAGAPLYDLFDSHQETMDVAEILYTPDLEEFAPLVQRLFSDANSSEDILLLNRLTIHPDARGQRLGLTALDQAIKDWSSGCSMIVMKPFPLQFEASFKSEAGSDSLELKKFTASQTVATKKLQTYYAQLGFKPIGRSKFYGLCTAQIRPTFTPPESFTFPERLLADAKAFGAISPPELGQNALPTQGEPL